VSKRQKRLIAIVVILALLLAALGAYFFFYQRTKRLSFNLRASVEGLVPPPEFLFSFSGEGADRLQRPTGVMVDGNRVYITDTERRKIYTFDLNGRMRGSFGTSEAVVPLFMAKNPKDGLLYVTDRGRRGVLKFSPDGKFIGVFDPKLPKNQLPPFKVPKGVQWTPVAIAFAPDGTMFVTETLNGHRLLVFSPDGKFLKSTGAAGIVNDPAKGADAFLFPNGLLVDGPWLYVSDSNNQRVKVYDLKGNYKRIIVTRGLPRGLAMLEPFPGDDGKAPRRFVEVDTLAHDATIWAVDGNKVLSFGQQGVLDGQFSYPNAISRGPRNRLFITDTANGRVQVWGWPTQVAGLPPISARTAPWCLVPLLLLPLLLLLRKKEFFATADFVEVMIARDDADLMPHRRRQWRTSEAEYEKIKLLATESIDFGKLFKPTAYSESDVQTLVDKYELDREIAISLAVARRAKVACTESDELRRMSKVMEIDVVNAVEFVQRFSDRENKAPHME
jgi:sugar lactone lactonase YvrE